ncbi:MAG: hypothetical protein QOG71_451 [Pyrinomonadaceae bacterium]|nr:hypothetical protein [Pyrinomonadaceae bacterium]
MDTRRKPSHGSTPALVFAAIFACGLIALSCNRQPAQKGAVEVANESANTSAGEIVNREIKDATPLAATPVSTPTPDSPIRKFDFGNFTYPSPDHPQGRKKIKLREGDQPPTQFSKHGIPRDIGYRLRAINYGDATGDENEEAIVTLDLVHSGTARVAYVYVYTLRLSRPALLWSFATGDRADGGLKKVDAENGELLVELMGRNKVIGTDLYADDGTNKGDCCPDAFTRTRYRWRDGRFRLQGKPEVIFLSAPTPTP